MPLDKDNPAVDYTAIDWNVPLPPLTRETIWQILREEIDDMVVDRLLWDNLGYRYDRPTNTWNIDGVSPDWQTDYPLPPDFIASRPATVKLTRSIPASDKQLLKEDLGFTGYKIGEFGPRQTRRATAANYLKSTYLSGYFCH
jgi:hypothetical protein